VIESRVERPQHAVVIGGGIAGLLAARAVADRFQRVTLLERDALPDGPDMRKKTPQAPHSHVLGAIGYRKLNYLFPGIDRDLAAAGAAPFDYVADCRNHVGHWLPRFASGLESRMCTRMLLEHAMRRRLAMVPNVDILDRQRVAQVLVSDDRRRVVGVERDDGSQLPADLVIDASGLGSRTPRLVEDLGCGEPEVNQVDLLSATVTQLFHPPPDIPVPDWVAVFVRSAPDNPRIGALTRIEGGLWRVSMSGLGGLYPPRTEEGFLAFTRDLVSQEIYHLIRDAQPASPIYYYGRSLSRWVRYDNLARFPDGIVVVGDAVFHANPEHAQGMTFCMMAAETLGSMLAASDRPLSERAGFSLQFQRCMAEKYRPYWLWNAAFELHLPGIVDESGLDRIDRLKVELYRRVRGLAPGDGALLCAAMKVTQAEREPSSLFHPALLWRLARRAVRG